MTELSDLARLPGDHRTVLLTRFRSGAASGQAGPRPTPRGGPLPLSSAQAQLWFLDRLAPGRSTYNVPAGYRVRGSLDVAALRAALADVATRHEVLRTSLYEHDGAGMQRVHQHVDVDLPVLEIDGPGPGGRLAAARKDAEELARTPFDLTVAPLWRARLYRLGTDDHLLVLVFHHLISDGWSIGVFADDLGAFYAARTGLAAAMPEPLTIQYADYACWQRGWLDSSAAGQLAQYWRDQLAGVSAVDFPTDRPRPASLTYEGSSLRRRLDPAVVSEVRAAAAAAGVTPYVMYLAAFLILLHRYTGQDDLTVGSPNANRGHAETERLIGFFVNMLVLRTSVAGDPSVRALLTQVHDVVREAMAHGELPFEQVVDAVRPVRDPSRSPLFQIGFGLQNAGAPLELPGLRITQEPIDLSTSRFDLSWNLTERPDGLEVQAEFSTDLFDPATVQALAGHYELVLRGVLADADRPVSRIHLLTPAERAELVHRWDGPALPVPRVSVAELFQRQVRRSPAATAVVVGGAEFSYDAVNRRANQLARLLTANGVTRGSRVALCLPRDLNLVIAMLAVLKAGAAYVPVDATHPPARVAVMLEDAAPAAVLTAGTLAGQLPPGQAVTRSGGPPVLVLDKLARTLAGYPDSDPDVDVSPEDVAYVIYTSGTTGRPKGVLIEHHSVAGFIGAVTQLFELTPADRILGFASVNFDVSVFETFAALLTGARLCLARDDERIDTAALQQMMEATGVTVTDLPPSVMALLDPDRLTSLRIVFVGGEAFSGDLVTRWNRGRRLFNGYGPTECTVAMTVYECAGRWASTPPIGLPMANHVAHVLDPHLEPVPYGVAGELVIGGEGLTRGYLNAARLTQEKIVPDPFGTAPGGRLYRTGDLVKRQRDGNIVYLGRMDQQVKIRGQRIELGEIETALATHPAVGQVAVQPWTDDGGEKHLVAYVSPAPGEAPDVSALRAHAAGQLPRYMVPSYVVLLDALPLTVSGKVNRRALPAPPEQARGAVGDAKPTTETERVIAEEIVSDLLRISRIGIHDNFFELGGNSLQMTQLVSRIRDRFGVEISLADLFQSPTVAHLAGIVDRAAALSDDEVLALIEQLPAEQAARLLQASEGSDW